MRIIKEVSIGDRRVTVRELDVSELRAWWADVQSGAGGGDMLDAALFPDISLTDLCRMTDLQPDDIGGLAPSEISAVIAVCREVNSFFFAMRERLITTGRALLSEISSVPSAPSSSGGIVTPGATQ